MLARASHRDPFADLDIDPARMRRWHPLHRSLYVEYKLMLPGHLLHGKGDRVAMHSGVECRYPYLDDDFIDLTRQLAPADKLRGLRDKWLLRQVASHVLPSAVADPPKSMFKAHAVCELAPHPPWIDQLLSPASLRATGYFSVARVARERELQRRLPAFAPRRFVVDGSFTAMITTQLWHHLYISGGLCELPRWTPPPAQPLADVARP
jgi:asparagine synthase (glutamine-hydrolysing)